MNFQQKFVSMVAIILSFTPVLATLTSPSTLEVTPPTLPDMDGKYFLVRELPDDEAPMTVHLTSSTHSDFPGATCFSAEIIHVDEADNKHLEGTSFWWIFQDGTLRFAKQAAAGEVSDSTSYKINEQGNVQYHDFEENQEIELCPTEAPAPAE